MSDRPERSAPGRPRPNDPAGSCETIARLAPRPFTEPHEMEYWNDFRALPYSDTLLVAAGALVTLLAVIRIVQSSLKMFFYVLLAGLGLAAVAHGAGRAPWESRLSGVALADMIGPGKEMSRDVLDLLCVKLEESRRE